MDCNFFAERFWEARDFAAANIRPNTEEIQNPGDYSASASPAPSWSVSSKCRFACNARRQS